MYGWGQYTLTHLKAIKRTCCVVFLVLVFFYFFGLTAVVVGGGNWRVTVPPDENKRLGGTKRNELKDSTKVEGSRTSAAVANAGPPYLGRIRWK